MDKQEVLQYLSERSQDFYDISDKIWDFAEARFTEEKSSEYYIRFLEKEGFKVTDRIGGLNTSFKAEWGCGKPAIGFLGEYDALSGLSQKAGVAVKEPVEEGGNGHGCRRTLSEYRACTCFRFISDKSSIYSDGFRNMRACQ